MTTSAQTEDETRCSYRQGLGASEKRCARDATAYCWYPTVGVLGSCDDHRSGLERDLQILTTFVRFEDRSWASGVMPTNAG